MQNVNNTGAKKDSIMK